MCKHRRSQCYIIIIQTTDGLVVIVWVAAAVPGTFGAAAFSFKLCGVIGYGWDLVLVPVRVPYGGSPHSDLTTNDPPSC
jgi:hypothetical protein